MTAKQKQEKARKLWADARALLESDNLSAEDMEKARAMMADAKALQAEADELKAIDEQMEDFTPEESAPSTSEGFKTFGSFLRAVKTADIGQGVDKRLQAWRKEDGPENKDITDAIGASAGYLAQPEFYTRMFQLVGEASIIRPGATVIPMRSRSLLIPYLKQSGTTAGQPHWFGGMIAYWTEEAGSKQKTQPDFGYIELVAHKLAAITRASDESLADSAVSLEAFLNGQMGYAGVCSWMEDYAFLRGTGGGMPLGILNSPALVTVARHADNPLIQYTDLVDMLEHFLPSARGRWAFSQSAIPDLMTMKDPSGQYLWPTLFQGGASAAQPGSIFGMPVTFTEKLPIVGQEGDALLYDPAFYVIGDREAVTVASSIHEKFSDDLTTWRVTERIDGQPWLRSPITLADGATTVSPFVTLGAKSS